MNSSDSKTFFQFVEEHAITNPDNAACVFQTHGVETAISLNYSSLIEKVHNRSSVLIQQGFRGKNVALLFPTGLEFVVNFLACLSAGVVAVPLNLSRNGQQLKRTIQVLSDAEVSAILTTVETRSSIESQLVDTKKDMPLDVPWIVESDIAKSVCHIPKPNLNDIAFIQYTSGSTSRPKGVLVSHRNIVDNQYAIRAACQHTHGLVAGGWLPQFHDMGLIGHMLQPLFLGGTYVFMPPMNFIQRPRRWLELISHYRIHSSASPNFGYEHCTKYISEKEDLSHIDLSCWKIALSGSEPVNAHTVSKFTSRFERCGFNRNAFFPCYGMAETTLFVSGGPVNTGAEVFQVSADALGRGKVDFDASSSCRSVVCCGVVSAGFDVKIVDPHSSLECDSDAIGEVWISGESVAKGYWNDPENTEASFDVPLHGEGRYLRTGDLGFVLNGKLYITGRLKEMLIVRGRNIFPYDIEQSCNEYQHASGNSGAALFQYEIDGEEKVGLLVEIKKSVLAKSDRCFLEQDIRDIVVGEYQVAPDYLQLVAPGTIPKTTSGKVKRLACRELVESSAHIKPKVEVA